MTDWVDIGDADAIGPSQIVDATNDNDDLVIWRTSDGRLCVIEARCPHQWSHLGAEGAVDGDEIVCTSHWWRFAIDGTATILRSTGGREPQARTTVYPCEERSGRVWIRP